MVALPPPTVLEAVRQALTRAGATAALEGLGDFLGRLDADYFEHEAPEDVALHARLAAELGPGRRARLAVTAREGGRYDVAVVAFDYFAELSILCGLLASHGLDIEAGHVHTLAAADAARPPVRAGRPPRPRPAPAAASRRIVDVFRVRPRDSRPPVAAELERELVELLDLVAQGRALEARERLNLRLVDALGAPAAPAEAPAPVEIRLDNAADPTWTVMDVRGPDTPGFLYALANALAMRGTYIHRVRIVSRAGEADDRFLVARADGRKLEEAEQEELRWAVGLIKQFTHFLPWAPDPARALRYFDQFLDRVASLEPAVRAEFSRPEALHDLARLLGSSAFLWEDLLRFRLERLLPVLARWRTRPIRTRAELQAHLDSRLAGAPDSEAIRRALDDVKDEELLLIDAKRLLDPEMTLKAFSAALADLAEALVGGAVEAVHARMAEREGLPVGADGKECPLAVQALGKFGGREMGHASDLELLFVYGEAPARTRSGLESGRFFDELVRRFTELFPAQAEGIFHIDLRLRPHGGKGTLASPLWAVRDYYRPGGEAAPFERQALIKLRFVGGDEELGRDVERVRDAFVWSGEPWDREAALHLRERQVRELVPPGRFNVKLSRGGLVDVEYAAQYLQVMHGRERRELRTPETLDALARLAAAGLLSADEHHVLREGYLFWRSVIDGLRVVRGHAGDLLLPEPGSDEYGFLARRLAYPGTRREAAAALAVDVERHRTAVSAVYDRRFRDSSA
jgi:[glutamine synthetase] adenylyltransferase / [glutamine synthetase]-adenylyl-L-tyrosine phosphorylase